MHSSVLLLFIILGLGYAHAQCGTNCTNGVEDDLFAVGAKYLTNGMAYVRDSSQPRIQAAHSADITTVVIVIHGNARDAYNYFCFANNAVEKAGVKGSTYVVAPHFFVKSLGDAVIPNALFWVSSASWKEGGKSDKSMARIASFEILDDMIAAFYNKAYFPGVTDVVVLGHSAGGQTVQRYAFATGIDKTYKVRYIVENSGSYAYLDTKRAVLPELTLPTCTACVYEDIIKAQYEFKLTNRTVQDACPEFNSWKMGYETGNEYLKLRTATVVRNEYKTKNVWYLLGTNDTCNTELGSCGCSDNSLDSGCEALLQGFCRLQRGVIFYQYLQNFYNAPVHNLSYVEGLAHDGCGMITSLPSLRAIFPNVQISDPTTTPSTTGSSDSSSTTSETPDPTENSTSDSTTSDVSSSTTDTISLTTATATTTSFGSEDDADNSCNKAFFSVVVLVSSILYTLL